MTDYKAIREALTESKYSVSKAAKSLGFNRGKMRSELENIGVEAIKQGIGQDEYKTHLYIPDTQVKPNIDTRYLTWIGRYIADKRPDVIIHGGDHWDFPSLSSYDRGKKKFEGRRLKADIDAGNKGLKDLEAPFINIDGYNPEMHITLGNHEERLMRFVNDNPEFDGVLSYDQLYLDNWQVHDFLKPAFIDGIAYCHYFANPFTGRAYGGSATNILNKLAMSFTMGHRQIKDIAEKPLIDGRMLRGLVAGASYPHDEDYKGYQGNYHWRGIVLKTEVKNGNYCLIEVSLDYLERRYESKEI